MNSKLIAVLALALICCLSSVNAHAYLSSPAPRAKTIGGHRFQYEPQSDGQFNGECQDGGKTGPIQATYVQGTIITVTISITASHNGAYQLRFCPYKDGNNNCLAQHLAIPISYPSSILPNFPNAHEGRSGEAQWRLPADLVCDNCVMQFWYQNNNGVQEHFKSCHDVRITAADGSVPSSTYSSSTTSTSSAVPITTVTVTGTSTYTSTTHLTSYECASKTSTAIPTTSTAIPTTTHTVTSTVSPTQTVTVTKTVDAECTQQPEGKCPCVPIPGSGGSDNYCAQMVGDLSYCELTSGFCERRC